MPFISSQDFAGLISEAARLSKKAYRYRPENTVSLAFEWLFKSTSLSKHCFNISSEFFVQLTLKAKRNFSFSFEISEEMCNISVLLLVRFKQNMICLLIG